MAGEHKDALDPAVPALYCLGLAFGESLGRHFRLIHDQSKVIDRNAVLLRTVHFLPNPARPGEFNQQLPVLGIEFVDSKAHPQLQVADWERESDGLRLTPGEAGKVVGFHPDYPWQGSRSSAVEQAADVFSLVVSAVVIGRVLSRTWEPAVRAHLTDLYGPSIPNQPRYGGDFPPHPERFCTSR
ncbi:hypothetical protein ACFRCI_16250 [Streptomyces sp. NPDC056638]|uniref:hypothetical protein n=1 Tax=Streptomyces sp. NPDC056638 TaxID=3345887 RepID=UPI00369CB33C